MSRFCICCELDIVLTRTVNILTTNELVNLKTLWTAQVNRGMYNQQKQYSHNKYLLVHTRHTHDFVWSAVWFNSIENIWSQREKTYFRTCAQSDQNLHCAHLDTWLGCKVSSCGQRRLWSDCVDLQTDMSFRWAQMSEVKFSHVEAAVINLEPISWSVTLGTVRLFACAGWTESAHFARAQRYIFACRDLTHSLSYHTCPKGSTSLFYVLFLFLKLLDEWQTVQTPIECRVLWVNTVCSDLSIRIFRVKYNTASYDFFSINRSTSTVSSPLKQMTRFFFL